MQKPPGLLLNGPHTLGCVALRSVALLVQIGVARFIRECGASYMIDIGLRIAYHKVRIKI